MSRTLSLNVGKDEDGNFWLCLVDMDGDESYPVAQFVDETHMTAFTLFMKTVGFDAIDLPSQADIDTLFE